MKEPFKVNESEFKLVQQIRNLKEKGFTDEDIVQLDRSKEIKKEQMQKMRLETIKVHEMQIIHKGREVKYKQDQLDKRECLEKHDDFVDGKKPLFMLESEIEITKGNITQLKEAVTAIQEEIDRDKKNAKKT